MLASCSRRMESAGFLGVYVNAFRVHSHLAYPHERISFLSIATLLRIYFALKLFGSSGNYRVLDPRS